MLQMIKMSEVSECVIADCAYNANKACHAIAITIGDGDRPMCDTLCRSKKHGGINDTAGVGACKVEICMHNKDLECSATSIQVGHAGSEAKCLTFTMN